MTDTSPRHSTPAAHPAAPPAARPPTDTSPVPWPREAAQLLREAIRDWPATLRLAFLLAVLATSLTILTTLLVITKAMGPCLDR